ncbi:MAG: type III pantothenate kinase [Flavobacteriaceae bacterium]
MNLVLDVGNSYLKMAVFDNNKLHQRELLKASINLASFLKTIKSMPDIINVIVSSVSELNVDIYSYLNDNYKLIELNNQLKFPFENCYHTPNTLGVDRLALAAAASFYYPNKNVLIIDAGTCITYDLINASNQYLGGGISPGIAMRYKSLNYFTSRLPLLDSKNDSELIGTDTNKSIESGVINGVISEIDGIISQYMTEFDDLTVVLTGGDSEFLSMQLKNSIFANSNFLLEGLNYLLQFNLD